MTTANKRKLTDAFINKLESGEKPFLTWDTQQFGLVIQTQPTGVSSFKCIYRFNSKPRWVTIGRVDAVRLEDARTEVADILRDIRHGKDPGAERRAKRSKGTLEELHARYINEHAKKKNKSWKKTEDNMKGHVIPRWGKLPAELITRADVKKLMTDLEDRPTLANLMLSSVSAVFSWAVKEEILKFNPCMKIDRNELHSRERTLSHTELQKFWPAFDDCGLLKSSALKLILFTAARPGEVKAMRWEDIKDNSWWELPGKPIGDWPGTKNGCNHRIPFSKAAQGLLEELHNGETSGPVFPKVGSLDAAMRKLCVKFNIMDKVVAHDLRRTSATIMASLGFTRQDQDRLLNHRDHSVSSTYDRYSYALEDLKIMEAVASEISKRIKGKRESNVFTLGKTG
jgi:integrase